MGGRERGRERRSKDRRDEGRKEIKEMAEDEKVGRAKKERKKEAFVEKNYRSDVYVTNSCKKQNKTKQNSTL